MTLIVFGMVISVILLFSNDAELANIGPFKFGDHWAIVASAALILGVQAGLFGLTALVYGYRVEFRSPHDMGVDDHFRLDRPRFWST